MSEKGQVISREGDKVVVRMKRSEACAKCGGCIEGLTSKEMLVNAINACDADTGDWVNVELEDSAFVRVVLIMYGIPFLGMITGFVMGYWITPQISAEINNELAGFIFGIVLMLISFLIIRLRKGKWGEVRYTPVAREK